MSKIPTPTGPNAASGPLAFNKTINCVTGLGEFSAS